jgi:hypothetical protein
MAIHFFNICSNFHPNYGCSLHSSSSQVYNCQNNKEMNEILLPLNMLILSSMYNLGSKVLLIIKRCSMYKSVICRDTIVAPTRTGGGSWHLG